VKSVTLNWSSPRHGQLARLILAERDFSAALRAVEHVIEHVTDPRDPLLDALECAAAICYARPFLAGRSHARISAKYERFDDDNQKTLHSFILKHRDEYAAHTNDKAHTVSIVLMKGKQAKWNTGHGTIANHGQSVEFQTLRPEAYPLFKALCEFQLQRIGADIEKEKDELFP
jgi:hypothetical protein